MTQVLGETQNLTIKVFISVKLSIHTTTLFVAFLTAESSHTNTKYYYNSGDSFAIPACSTRQFTVKNSVVIVPPTAPAVCKTNVCCLLAIL